MWMRCLCLLLLCQQALNIQIISREVSEASLDINTDPFHHVSGPAKCLSLKDKTKSDSCLVERCTEQCLVREQNNKQQVRLDFIITKSWLIFYVQNQREYKIGCKLMQSFFTSVKVNPVIWSSQVMTDHWIVLPGEVPSNRARVSAGQRHRSVLGR